MKSKIIYLLLSISTLCICSCGEDRSGEYEARIAEDKWIKEQMDNIYLWYYDMPEESKLDFFKVPEDFFKSLLSTKCQEGKGDKYSYLETIETKSRSIDSESTYGFDFVLFQPSQTPKQMVARVLFVLKDSPAAKAGIKRGNWISGVNGEVLTKDNYGYLYKGAEAEFSLAQVDTIDNTALWKDTANVKVSASQPMENNPFYLDTVYHIGGKNIAYMMYNAFATGPTDNPYDETYNNQMRSIFAGFKGANINDFILDMRYNPGGYLSCSQVLASLLAPADKLGQPYCSLAFNDLNETKDTTYTLREDLTGGNNLNLSRLYVIVTDQTASASEAVINCLRPYMEIKLIGTKTEGKNVASLPIKTEEFPGIILHPIVAIVNNSKGESNYFKGMTPDYELNEADNAKLVDTLQPLGDTNEYLLKNTLTLVTTGSIPGLETEEEEKNETKAILNRQLKSQLKYIGNSMDRKKGKRNGVLLTPR